MKLCSRFDFVGLRLINLVELGVNSYCLFRVYG